MENDPFLYKEISQYIEDPTNTMCKYFIKQSVKLSFFENRTLTEDFGFDIIQAACKMVQYYNTSYIMDYSNTSIDSVYYIRSEAILFTYSADQIKTERETILQNSSIMENLPLLQFFIEYLQKIKSWTWKERSTIEQLVEKILVLLQQSELNFKEVVQLILQERSKSEENFIDKSPYLPREMNTLFYSKDAENILCLSTEHIEKSYSQNFLNDNSSLSKKIQEDIINYSQQYENDLKQTFLSKKHNMMRKHFPSAYNIKNFFLYQVQTEIKRNLFKKIVLPNNEKKDDLKGTSKLKKVWSLEENSEVESNYLTKLKIVCSI